MATVSDNFDRANSADLGTDFTPQTGAAAMRVNTNEAKNIGTGLMSAEYYSSLTFGNDQEASGVVGAELESQTGIGSEYGIGPAIRMATGDQSKYAVIMSSDAAREFQLLKFDTAGVITVLGTYTAGTPATGDIGLVRAIGTTISGHLNGIERISVTDATLASGRIGLCGRQSINACGLASWSGGDVALTTLKRILQETFGGILLESGMNLLVE